jgi:serine/threonine-protein kinase
MVGLVIDERYEVMQLLGEGGMGCVYRVRHRVLERSFALKVLRPELSRDLVLAERFVQEARAAAAIVHPNVVSITDFGMFGSGQPYFVMELLDGRTLSSLLRERGALNAEEVIAVAKAMASALSSAHAVGVIHRDLKPDNVILVGGAIASTSVKVLDFGLAVLLGASRLTQDSVVYGTPQYMSPEQAAGEPIDARVDVYALGILMYEMLTGRVPFEADSYMGVLTKQLYAEPAVLVAAAADTALGDALCAVVMRCLCKNRDERYASMQDVLFALKAIDHAPTSGRSGGDDALAPVSARGPLQSRVIRRAKRGWRWWLFAVVGTLALGSALGLLFGKVIARMREDARSELSGQALHSPSDPSGMERGHKAEGPNSPNDNSPRLPRVTRKFPRAPNQRKDSDDVGHRAEPSPRPNPTAPAATQDAIINNGPPTRSGSSEFADPWAK